MEKDFPGASIAADDNPKGLPTITITLNSDEFDRLLLMMGFAVGAAHKQDQQLAYDFLDLVNRVNRDNPKFRKYAIPGRG
jgi:hypothetical protein